MAAKKVTLKKGNVIQYPQTTDDMVFIEGDPQNKTVRQSLSELGTEVSQLGQKIDGNVKTEETFYGNITNQNAINRASVPTEFSLQRYDIVGITRVKIQTTLPANQYCGEYSFRDSNGDALNDFIPSPAGGGSLETEIDVPNGSVTLYVAIVTGTQSSVISLPNIAGTLVNLDERLADVEQAIGGELFETNVLDGVETIYWIDSTGNLRDSLPTYYGSFRYDVSKIRTKVKVETGLNEWAVHLYTIMDENGNVLAHGASTFLKREEIIDLSLYDNAKYLYVSYDANTKSASATLVDVLIDLYNGRKKIHIHTTDSQVEILTKLINAFETQNCDVFFDYGTYVFSDVYIYMRDTLGWTWTMELPIGGNCRYYLNNSTLISNAPTQEYSGERSLLGVRGSCQSFELYDGTLVNNEGTYVVHDEGNNAPGHYRHLYKNIVMKYNTINTEQQLGKCLGMGAGQYGVIELQDCALFSQAQKTLDWHGNANTDAPLSVRIVISGCFFDKQVLIRDIRNIDYGVIMLSNSELPNDVVNETFEVIKYRNQINP